MISLPETNIAYENPHLLPSKWWISHGYVSFPEGSLQQNGTWIDSNQQQVVNSTFPKRHPADACWGQWLFGPAQKLPPHRLSHPNLSATSVSRSFWRWNTRFFEIGKTQWNLGVEGWTEILKSWDYSRSSVEKHDFRNWISFCFGPSSGQPENANLGSPSCCHSRGCDGRSRSACRSISGTSPKSIGPSVTSVKKVRITQLGWIKDFLSEDSSCQNPIQNWCPEMVI